MIESTPTADEVASYASSGGALPRLQRLTGGDRNDFPSIGENGATRLLTSSASEDDRPQRRDVGRVVADRIPAVLIRKAEDLVSSMDPEDEVTLRLCLQDLASTLGRMWQDSAGCSQPHLDILATLERAVCEARGGAVTREQISAFREALGDLAQSYVTPAHADVIRSRFLDVGFGALSFVDGARGDQAR